MGVNLGDIFYDVCCTILKNVLMLQIYSKLLVNTNKTR